MQTSTPLVSFDPAGVLQRFGRLRWMGAAAALCAASATAAAQNFNVDVGSSAEPSADFGPLAQIGHWNLVPHSPSGAALLDISGAPTAAAVTCSPAGYGGSLITASGNMGNLLNDFQDLAGGPHTWTVSGIANGPYRVTLYSQPDPLFVGVAEFEVQGGALGPQTCTSPWVGFFSGLRYGESFVQDEVTVANGTLSWTATEVQSYAYFNGFQIERIDPGTTGSYCQAAVNSQGCTPLIYATGVPSASGSTLRVKASGVVNNKTGMLFWSLRPQWSTFYGGTLCVMPPVVRTPLQDSGGNPPPDDCSGEFSHHFGTGYLAQKGLFPGEIVHCQYWSRDPAASTTNLTAGLYFVVAP